MADPVWFWQRIVSPHMAGLAEALAASGREVTYVAEQQMSAARTEQGWQPPAFVQASLRFAPTADAVRQLALVAPASSIHICQGLRGNGLVGVARRALRSRGLRQWVITETVDDWGWRGPVKRLAYWRLIRQWRSRIEGILAIGHATPAWLAARSMPSSQVYDFAYFLPATPAALPAARDPARPFRLLFVGRLVKLKRIELLLEALTGASHLPFDLTIVGAGPLETELRVLAEAKLPGRVRWLGGQPIGAIPAHMAAADCLVLPSRHDGWGAVVSEALMAGTPAICSDACGAAGAVRASGVGGVFATGDVAALTRLLARVIAQGAPSPEQRSRLAAWARCLGAEAGARYLDTILAHATSPETSPRPIAPWTERQQGGAL